MCGVVTDETFLLREGFVVIMSTSGSGGRMWSGTGQPDSPVSHAPSPYAARPGRAPRLAADSADRHRQHQQAATGVDLELSARGDRLWLLPSLLLRLLEWLMGSICYQQDDSGDDGCRGFAQDPMVRNKPTWCRDWTSPVGSSRGEGQQMTNQAIAPSRRWAIHHQASWLVRPAAAGRQRPRRNPADQRGDVRRWARTCRRDVMVMSICTPWMPAPRWRRCLTRQRAWQPGAVFTH